MATSSTMPWASLPSTTTRSPSSTASSMSCVTSSRVTPWRWARPASRSCSFMRVKASTAEKGSSSSSTRGWAYRARAMAARCAWPPESCLGRAWAWAASPTSASRASACSSCRGAPMPKATFCATVSHGNRRGSWNTTPMSRGAGRPAASAKRTCPV
mmetsp:Transcript_41238/g.96545  ORF Transcript_41238/g.96545 Transcript_41238/m.96545 type:complete len:157 (+) Transcript_41238:268-738(+)